MFPRKESHRIGGGTPGQPSEALQGIIENVLARIAIARAEGRDEDATSLQEGLDVMRKGYDETGRIETGPTQSPLLRNIAESPAHRVSE